MQDNRGETDDNPPVDGRKRRTMGAVFVEPFKQVTIGLYVIGVCIAFVIATSTLYVYTFIEQYRHVMSIFNVVDPGMQWEVITNEVFWSNMRAASAFFLLFIVVIFAVVLRMTHKYYGPLVSIERFVDEISGGKYFARVTVRQGDELQRMAGKLNLMAENLQRKHGHRVDAEGQKIERRRGDSSTPTVDVKDVS